MNIINSKRILKVVLASGIVLLFSFFLLPKSIYSIPFNNMDNQKVNLFQYNGKKIIFITLTGKEADSTLGQLAAFSITYKNSAAIIGVLSIEDGYDEANKKSLKVLYKSKIPGLILTEAMYTRSSSTGQSALMQWLTHKEQNMRMDVKVTEAGYKFFLDEDGLLYGVLGSNAALTSPIIQRIMSKPRRPGLSAAELEKRRNEMKRRNQRN
jgi:glutathione peroxidase